jgi:hypothetical protein
LMPSFANSASPDRTAVMNARGEVWKRADAPSGLLI